MLDIKVVDFFIYLFLHQMVILYFCGCRCGMNVMKLAAVNSWGFLFWLGYFFQGQCYMFSLFWLKK